MTVKEIFRIKSQQLILFNKVTVINTIFVRRQSYYAQQIISVEKW